MINLVNVPGRTSKTEMTPNLDRKKNGYKMSNKARTMLGISHDSASKLAIGENDGSLWIKAVGDTEPNNAHVSKLSMINKNGVIEILDGFGNHFTITDEVVDGYHRMEATTVTKDTTDTEENDADIHDEDMALDSAEPTRSFSVEEDDMDEDFG